MLIKKKKEKEKKRIKKNHEKFDRKLLHTYIAVCSKADDRLVLQLQGYVQLYSASATDECSFSGEIDFTGQTSIIAHQHL